MRYDLLLQEIVKSMNQTVILLGKNVHLTAINAGHFEGKTFRVT